MVWGRQRAIRRKASHNWHQAILRQVRDPELYLQEILPDTLDGRFHMLTLVTALVLRRLREEERVGRKLADQVYRDVFSGIEHALREEGVGDHSIARKMRARGEAFFGIARALDTAFEQEDSQEQVAAVLTRNGICASGHCQEMTVKLFSLVGELDTLATDQAMTGRPGW